jgi:hypothetical protein
MAEPDAMAVRDSANRPGLVIRYSANAWRAFLVQVKDGLLV